LVKNEIWVPFGKQMYSNKYKTHRVIATTQIHTWRHLQNWTPISQLPKDLSL